MKVVALNSEKINDFIEYCRKHRNEVDGSYLYDKDFNEFEPNKEHPTYMVTNKLGKVVAAASLIIDDYNQRGRTARFRIFHSKKKTENVSNCFYSPY